MQIRTVVLTGARVVLQPLGAEHLPGLAAAIDDGDLWKIPVTLVPKPTELGNFLAAALAQFEAGKELAFAVVDRSSGHVIGSSRFRNIDAEHRRVEIGFTFYAGTWQRTHVNTESKYLMLRHAFEHWGVNRVEFQTDALNQPSLAAIERIGATMEGVLRSHMIMRGGRVRDTVVFSIVAAEWSSAKTRLEERMRRHCGK